MEMFMTMLPTLVDALKEPLLHHLQREINKRTPAKATREPCSEAAAVQDPLFKQFREVSVVGSDMHSSLSSHPFFRLNLTDNDQCIWGEKLSDFFKLSQNLRNTYGLSVRDLGTCVVLTKDALTICIVQWCMKFLGSPSLSAYRWCKESPSLRTVRRSELETETLEERCGCEKFEPFLTCMPSRTFDLGL